MKNFIKVVGVQVCLGLCISAYAGPMEVTLIKRNATVNFDNVGTVQSRSIECDVGSTLVSAEGFSNDDEIVESGVKIHAGGPPGRTAHISFRRNATESDIQTISAGGTVASLSSTIKLRATCLTGINVKMYGAVGDGVTLDNAAIAQAIADAPVDGTVYFPAGNYVINEDFAINKRIKLVGDGPSTQIFQSDSAANVFVVTARGVRISDMYLGSASTAPDTALLNLQRAHYADVENIIMRGSYYGLWAFGTLSSKFTNIRTDANIGVAYFAAASTSQNQTWIRTERDTTNLFSANANVFIHPMLEGGLTCFHHSDFGGAGNFTIFGGVIQGCQTVGLKVEGNGGTVNVYGTHFENNYEVFGALDVETDTSFGLNLNGVFSVGKFHFKNIGSEHAIMNSMVNRVEIDPGIKRTIMFGSKHSNTAPGLQITDNSGGHSYYAVNGVIQSLLSPSATTIGLGTAGPPSNTSGQPASLEVNGPGTFTSVTP